MSSYSFIGLIALAVVAAAGTAIKIVLSCKRKKQDGVHGYVREKESEDGPSAGWRAL